MKLTENQILKIADELDCGLICYLNKKTGEIKSVIDSQKWIYDDNDFWIEILEEIEKDKDDYIEFVGFESSESFQIMVDFTETIDQSDLKVKLINALNNKKPFQNFKWIIDNSGEFRQKWFDFKKIRHIDWVKEQYDFHINKMD